MRFKFWKALLSHWSTMLVGGSYWHASQGLGPCFTPGELGDYYRDYSSKVYWNGAVDQGNFPLVEEPGGRPFHHPIVLAQKALGHYSCWLETQRKKEEHYRAFMELCRWFVGAQEDQGSWIIQTMAKPPYLVPYSAMVQGQAISVLIRGFFETSEKEYLEAAHKAYQFMLKPVSEGGTCRITGEGLVFEEYPKRIPDTVLNGWISALYGLYDFFLLTKRPDIQESMKSSLKALGKNLERFNAGYWSYYDTKGTLASPYYHQVHITQLRALELTFTQEANSFSKVRKCFELQQSSRFCCAKAILVKGIQKLKHPPESVFVQSKAASGTPFTI